MGNSLRTLAKDSHNIKTSLVNSRRGGKQGSNTQIPRKRTVTVPDKTYISRYFLDLIKKVGVKI